MKIEVITYLIFTFCLGQVFSQELRMMPRDVDETYKSLIDFDVENSNDLKSISFLQLGSDLYNLRLINYEISFVSLGINSRLEEELPYEDTSYDYTGFYYLDFGINYRVDDFSIGLSIENFLNLDSKNFSIDPIIEQSNGFVNGYYFSHEADTLFSMTLTYNF
ncbi:MAG: hypothetical protein ACJAZK_000291 [Psychroserpens sp.]|uniref:hypothetical protein n=1 Tax=Psychroserpens sp. TaxID=2020870 RepID=UPI0039E69D57